MLTQRGNFLLEVMICLVLLSLALLTLDAMQVKSMREAMQTNMTSLAIQQLQNITEQLLTPHIDLTKTIVEWNKENAQLLPNGKGEVIGSFPHYQVTIFWGDAKPHDCQTIQKGVISCLKLML